eukprot:gene6802-9495_t
MFSSISKANGVRLLRYISLSRSIAGVFLSSSSSSSGFYLKQLQEMKGPPVLRLNRLRELAAQDKSRREMKTGESAQVNLVDVRHWNVVASAFARQGDVRVVKAILSEMFASGYSPSLASHNILVTAHAMQGDNDAAWAYIAHMKQKGFRPDRYTFRAIASMYARQSQTDAIYKLLSETLPSWDIEADINLYNALISSCTSLERLQTAYRDLLHANVNPTCRTYTLLLRNCKQLALNPYLTANIGTNYPLQKRMKEFVSSVYKKAVTSSQKLDTFFFNTAIDALAHCGLHHLLQTVILDMEQQEVRPTPHTYSSLLRASALLAQPARAERVLNALFAAGFKPSSEDMAALTLAYARSHKLTSSVSKALARMASRKLYPPDTLLPQLISSIFQRNLNSVCCDKLLNACHCIPSKGQSEVNSITKQEAFGMKQHEQLSFPRNYSIKSDMCNIASNIITAYSNLSFGVTISTALQAVLAYIHLQAATPQDVYCGCVKNAIGMIDQHANKSKCLDNSIEESWANWNIPFKLPQCDGCSDSKERIIDALLWSQSSSLGELPRKLPYSKYQNQVIISTFGNMLQCWTIMLTRLIHDCETHKLHSVLHYRLSKVVQQSLNVERQDRTFKALLALLDLVKLSPSTVLFILTTICKVTNPHTTVHQAGNGTAFNQAPSEEPNGYPSTDESSAIERMHPLVLHSFSRTALASLFEAFVSTAQPSTHPLRNDLYQREKHSVNLHISKLHDREQSMALTIVNAFMSCALHRQELTLYRRALEEIQRRGLSPDSTTQYFIQRIRALASPQWL